MWSRHGHAFPRRHGVCAAMRTPASNVRTGEVPRGATRDLNLGKRKQVLRARVSVSSNARHAKALR